MARAIGSRCFAAKLGSVTTCRPCRFLEINRKKRCEDTARPSKVCLQTFAVARQLRPLIGRIRPRSRTDGGKGRSPSLRQPAVPSGSVWRGLPRQGAQKLKVLRNPTAEHRRHVLSCRTVSLYREKAWFTQSAFPSLAARGSGSGLANPAASGLVADWSRGDKPTWTVSSSPRGRHGNLRCRCWFRQVWQRRERPKRNTISRT